MSDSKDVVRWGTDPHMHRAVMSATMQVDSSISHLVRLKDPARAARARDLLFMSVRNLQSARVGAVICERLEGESHEELLEMLRAEADALEHTGMSLALEDTMTALDLCAATTEAYFDPASQASGLRVPPPLA